MHLEELSSENLGEVLALEVREDQKGFLPSIDSSIEMAKAYPDAVCLAVCVSGTVCGFALYGTDEESGSWKIFRLLIDRRFQGQGFGRRAMNLLLSRLCAKHAAHEVRIVYRDSNEAARQLYDSLGFIEYERRGDKILSKATLASA